jgi:hypothetical protein
MSFYVKRSCVHEFDTSGAAVNRQGWTGPIRSEHQAQREVDAWRTAGWTAELVAATPAVKSEVRTWQLAANQAGVSC